MIKKNYLLFSLVLLNNSTVATENTNDENVTKEEEKNNKNITGVCVAIGILTYILHKDSN
jgi:hypothetical protein